MQEISHRANRATEQDILEEAGGGGKLRRQPTLPWHRLQGGRVEAFGANLWFWAQPAGLLCCVRPSQAALGEQVGQASGLLRSSRMDGETKKCQSTFKDFHDTMHRHQLRLGFRLIKGTCI